MERPLIVVPTYNECRNVQPLIDKLLTAAPAADILLVDDASPDGTADLAERLFGALPRFSVLRRTGARGLGRSYKDAYHLALGSGYLKVVQMDADLSHDPDRVPDLLLAADSADVAIGSRYCPGGGMRDWPLARKALSRCANWYIRAAISMSVADATSGFRCYTRRALESIDLDQIGSSGFAFQVEMTFRAVRAGLCVAEVPIQFVNRQHGRSKMTREVIFEMALLPWRLRLAARSASHVADHPPGQ